MKRYTSSDHTAHVAQIQEQVRSFVKRKQKVRIFHGTTNSTRLQTFENGSFVDVSHLNHILKINVTEGYAIVEPNVAMDELTAATLKLNLIPPVVPEFPGITIGGAVQGGAEESSSFKYGMVHDTCLEYEIVLGNGELITASPTSHPDLFTGTAASYGSLGILTLIKLKLIPAKPYVHLIYQRVTGAKTAIDLIEKQTQSPTVDFVDGILFSPTHGVVISGHLSDHADLPIARFSRAYDNWHYLHAEDISTRHDHYEELVPIVEYLFRYDRGSFWMGKHGLARLPIPFNRVTRFLLNFITKTRASYRFLKETQISQQYVLQDFNLPVETASDFLAYLDRTVVIYPLWLCPLKPGDPSGWSANDLATNLVINIGVWGPAPHNFQSFVTLNRALERESTRLGGRKMLYAQAYYPEHEFWQLYDRTRYNKLRSKYHASVLFPTLFEKTNVKQQYQPSVLRGLWRLLWSPKTIPITATSPRASTTD